MFENSVIKSEEKSAIAIFVYGSLRVGLYNYKRFDLDKYESIKNVTLKGFYEIYTFEGLGYPFLSPSDTFNSIEGDIIFITDHNVFNSIERMELCAGYERETETINETFVCFWISKRESQFHGKIFIPNNNWLQFMNMNNNVIKRKKLVNDWAIIRTSNKTKIINDWIIKTKSTNTVQDVYSLIDSLKIERKLPPRDAKGRFIKEKK